MHEVSGSSGWRACASLLLVWGAMYVAGCNCEGPLVGMAAPLPAATFTSSHPSASVGSSGFPAGVVTSIDCVWTFTGTCNYDCTPCGGANPTAGPAATYSVANTGVLPNPGSALLSMNLTAPIVFNGGVLGELSFPLGWMDSGSQMGADAICTAAGAPPAPAGGFPTCPSRIVCRSGCSSAPQDKAGGGPQEEDKDPK